jgi:ABC-type phosphate transport system auxiliary subunit
MYYFTLYIYLSLKVFEKGGTWLWVTAETIPYLGAAVVGLLIVLFISPIRNMMFKGDLSALEEAGKRMIGKTALLHDLQKKELKEAYGS